MAFLLNMNMLQMGRSVAHWYIGRTAQHFRFAKATSSHTCYTAWLKIKKMKKGDWVIGICHKFVLAWSALRRLSIAKGLEWALFLEDCIASDKWKPCSMLLHSINISLKWAKSRISWKSSLNMIQWLIPAITVLKPVKRTLPDNLKPWWTWICGSLQQHKTRCRCGFHKNQNHQPVYKKAAKKNPWKK